MLNKTALEQMIHRDRNHRLSRLAKQYRELSRSKKLQEKLMASAGRTLSLSRQSDGILLPAAKEEMIALKAAVMSGEVLLENKFGTHMEKAVEEITKSDSCLMVGDGAAHRNDAYKLGNTWSKLLFDILVRDDLLITKESFGNYLKTNMELMSCMVSARAEMLHVLLIGRSLGISIVESMGRLMEGHPYIGLAAVMETDVAMQAISGMQGKDESVLALILLKTLYPTNPEKRLAEIAFRAAQVPVACPKKVDALAGRVRELIDADESELLEYRNEFGGDAEKIAKAISISRAGASKKLSVFAVENSLGEKEISFMIDVEETICGSWAECRAVFSALGSLSPENREKLLCEREALRRAEGWLALMPNYMRERPALGFLLGLHFNVPDDKASAYSFLTGQKGKLYEALLLNEKDLDGMESELDAFIGSLRGFVKEEKKADEAAARPAPEPARHARPYESLKFPPEAETAMRNEGTDPLDIKIALVCGLRLNSAKGARGKHYFNSAVFRRNMDRDLREELKRLGTGNGDKTDIGRRREAAERFLTKHNIISFYKSGREVVRLNVGDCGQKPDNEGQMVINATIRWMNEFQQETSI